MTRERLYLFDTTLRDGAQTNGVDFTLHDKLAVAALLDDLGVDYVEGGYPGANPTDTDLALNASSSASSHTRLPRPTAMQARKGNTGTPTMPAAQVTNFIGITG